MTEPPWVSGLRFVKGHGTQNDFVLLPDPDGLLDLTAEFALTLCDRRAGLGADGVLRAVRVSALADPPDDIHGAQWFMDYRNSDGSLAQMCGNGLRVFARYLVDAGLAEPGEVPVATRAGLRVARLGHTGEVSVDMGAPEPIGTRPLVNGRPGTAVSMGNPHVVVPLASAAELTALDLTRPPVVDPPLPSGQNVEFVVRAGPRRIALRVHERGSGETRSCGTGVCAAVVETVRAEGVGRGEPWIVNVPGGQLTVEWTPAGAVLLTGPAVLVAEGELRTQV